MQADELCGHFPRDCRCRHVLARPAPHKEEDHRLPHRRRASLLLGAASLDPPSGRCAPLGDDGRSLSPWRAHLAAPPQLPDGRLYDGRRAHAARPPCASRMDPVALDPLGRDGRSADCHPRRADSGEPAASRAGAIDPVWACSGSRSNTGQPASKPRARAPWRWAPARIATSPRC